MQIQVIVINFWFKIITITTTVLFNVSSLKWNHNIHCNDKKRYRCEKRRRLEKEHVVIFKDLFSRLFLKMRIINPLCLQNILTRHKIVCLFFSRFNQHYLFLISIRKLRRIRIVFQVLCQYQHLLKFALQWWTIFGEHSFLESRSSRILT